MARTTAPAIQELIADGDIDVSRSVEFDWVARTERTSGPVPNPVEVWADHTDDYRIEIGEFDGDTATFYITEV